jgi:hypothetical protein
LDSPAFFWPFVIWEGPVVITRRQAGPGGLAG